MMPIWTAPEIHHTAFLLGRIIGRPATPVFVDGAWVFRFEVSSADAGALIAVADNPDRLVEFMAPIFARYRETL